MTDRQEADLHARMRQVSLLTAFSAAAATHETRPGSDINGPAIALDELSPARREHLEGVLWLWAEASLELARERLALEREVTS